MKYLSLLLLTVFFMSSCAHNRIQFGPKYKKNKSAKNRVEPLIVHATQDTLNYEVDNPVLAQSNSELEGSSLGFSKINKVVISRYTLPVKKIEKTVSLLIDNEHQPAIIDNDGRQKHNKANGNIALGIIFLTLALLCFFLTLLTLYHIIDGVGFIISMGEALAWFFLLLALSVTFFLLGIKFLKKGISMKREVSN